MAALLHYYRIDAATIVDRLVERGCSPDLADWIVQTVGEDHMLAKKVEETETPEPTLQVVLRGLNGVVMLVIVGLIAHFIQITDNLVLLFVCSPLLLIVSFVGFFMTIRMIAELGRRLKKDR